MKVDMHIHSIYSADGMVSVKDVLKIAKKRGLEAIAITDHNEIKGALKAMKMGVLPVIPGIEISTISGHVLAYGIDCIIPRDLEIEETIEKVHECGGIAVAAHPYRFWSGIGEKNVRHNKFDAIEIFNARCKKKSNLKARKLGYDLGLPFTAGSDAHYPEEIGRAGLITESDDVLDSILKKKVKIFGVSRNMYGTIKYVKRAVSQWITRGFRRI